MGAIEEATPEEYRPMFETNVFGLIETTRAALPAAQADRRPSGQSLVGRGHRGGASYGYYNATKFAVEGLSEALAQELAPLGLAVIIVEPGPFRTEFLGRSIVTAKAEIDAYAGTSGKLRHYRDANNGRPAGDPEKAEECGPEGGGCHHAAAASAPGAARLLDRREETRLVQGGPRRLARHRPRDGLLRNRFFGKDQQP